MPLPVVQPAGGSAERTSTPGAAKCTLASPIETLPKFVNEAGAAVLHCRGLLFKRATRSGAERHATRFGGYFVAALGDSSADLDKNRVISAQAGTKMNRSSA